MIYKKLLLGVSLVFAFLILGGCADPGREISGKVVDAETNEPIQNALVVIYDEYKWAWAIPLPAYPDRGRGVAKTDSDGIFSTFLKYSKITSLIINHPDYHPVHYYRKEWFIVSKSKLNKMARRKNPAKAQTRELRRRCNLYPGRAEKSTVSVIPGVRVSASIEHTKKPRLRMIAKNGKVKYHGKHHRLFYSVNKPDGFGYKTDIPLKGRGLYTYKGDDGSSAKIFVQYLTTWFRKDMTEFEIIMYVIENRENDNLEPADMLPMDTIKISPQTQKELLNK